VRTVKKLRFGRGHQDPGVVQYEARLGIQHDINTASPDQFYRQDRRGNRLWVDPSRQLGSVPDTNSSAYMARMRDGTTYRGRVGGAMPVVEGGQPLAR